ncbi:helix-turn-helix transcriptional regulator [Streptomyces sp. NPDC015232]|uniref:helix-turn-helix transcriptional regulator n=1 Tax=unclassified Streptomyces TaxID=2593676 RepID=UPI0036F57EC4
MSGSSETRRARCGEDFTAVRVPADLAHPALAALGPRTGPVLANRTTQTWHFLLPLGSTLPDDWPYGVRVMPDGRPIGIPPLTTTDGRDVHWAVPPGRGVTSPAHLHRLLNGPLPTASLTPSPRGPQFPSRAPVRVTASRPCPLTPAQLKVGRLLLTGAPDTEMAVELGVPVGTVRQQLNRIGRRFGAPTAVRKAVALLTDGHVTPPPVSMLAPDLSPADLTVLRVLGVLITSVVDTRGS